MDFDETPEQRVQRKEPQGPGLLRGVPLIGDVAIEGPVPGEQTEDIGVGPDPVAALTLGRVRLRRLLPFLRASARAEGEAAANPEMLAGTALARPPRLVCTFSLWRTAQAMREYAQGDPESGHPRAVAEHLRRLFHHESVFVRLRPYASSGAWDGRDPLALTRR